MEFNESLVFLTEKGKAVRKLTLPEVSDWLERNPNSPKNLYVEQKQFNTIIYIRKTGGKQQMNIIDIVILIIMSISMIVGLYNGMILSALHAASFSYPGWHRLSSIPILPN